MSGQQQRRQEEEGESGRVVVGQQEPEVFGRIELGAPNLGEMVATYIFTCPDCETTFNSYHTVTSRQQLLDMCPKCNARGQKLKRVQHNTLRNEFAVEFVLTFMDAIRYDDYGTAIPVPASRIWSIMRAPISVRKKYGVSLGRRYLGVFGPLVVRAGLDAGDRQTMGIEKFPLANGPLAGKKQYEGTAILRTCLLEHGKKVAWCPSEHDPIPAYDGENKSPYVAEFEYHRRRP
jgi:hypothetical protein